MKYKILLIVLSLALVNTVDAKEYIEVNCKKESEYYECNLIADLIVPTSSIEYTYSLDSSVTLIEFRKNNIWEGDNHYSIISLGSLHDQQGKVLLGTLVLSSDKEITNEVISTKRTKFYNSEYELVDFDKLNNVNEIDKEEKKDKTNKNNIIYYVIIILSIVVVITVIFYKKKGVKR